MAQGETGGIVRSCYPAGAARMLAEEEWQRDTRRDRGWRGYREPEIPDSDTAMSRKDSWRWRGCQRLGTKQFNTDLFPRLVFHETVKKYFTEVVA